MFVFLILSSSLSSPIYRKTLTQFSLKENQYFFYTVILEENHVASNRLLHSSTAHIFFFSHKTMNKHTIPSLVYWWWII